MRSLMVSILTFSFLLTTGCGSPGSAANSAVGGVNSQSVAAAVNISQVKASVATANASLTNAQAALDTIFSSSGSFNWSIFLGGVNFTTLGANTQTCLANAFPKNNVLALVLTAPADIATALKCILDDVASVAGIANTDLTNAMSILNASLAQTTPGSADALAIQAMIDEVTPLQASYNTLMMSLGSQMSIVSTFLGELPTLATGVIPIPILSLFVGMGINAFIQPIEQEIMHFQSQIEAL
jgi:hypothetical protein